jgi:putative phosphoribosyl transferase
MPEIDLDRGSAPSPQRPARFLNRSVAGKVLAQDLDHYAGQPALLVLALPRGGVPVAFEVARALGAPLDICVVRKLGVPGHEELAMGAIASGGMRVMNEEVARYFVPSPAELERAVARETAELQRRERLYRGGRPAMPLENRSVILVDDGLATGATMRAAIAAVRHSNPHRVAVAVPVAAVETCRQLGDEADEVVCSLRPEPFHAVSLGYAVFTQTTDEEVQRLLERARA